MSYMRLGASAAVAVPVVAVSTLGTYAGSATQAAIGEVKTAAVPNASGLYELHLPNNGLSTGARAVTFVLSDTGNSEAWVVSPIEFQLTAWDVSTELYDVVVDSTVTARQSLRLANSANAGKLSGAATLNVKVRDLADTKDRIDATVDTDGNRTVVTRDVT